MMPVPKVELEGKCVKFLKKRINPQFIEWLNKANRLNINRVLEISTYLLNFSICQNYFPIFNALTKEFPSIVPENLTKEKIRELRINYEKTYGLFILIVLRYFHQKSLNQIDTDKEIDILSNKGDLVQSFFFINSLPEKIEIKELIDYIGKAFLPDPLLPQLDFDPEFNKILEDDAIKELYDTSFITDWLDSKPPKKKKYLMDVSMLKNLLRMRDKPYERFFEMDNKLGISKFNYKQNIYLGHYFFSSNKHIEDIMNLFKNYYSKRIPKKTSEISRVLDGFKTLFKIIDGKSYFKIRLGKIKTLLNKEFDKEFVNEYIERYLFNKSRNRSSLESNHKSISTFFNYYHDFLCSAGYTHSGFVYTGIFIIWRSLIKYLEGLHKDTDFKNFKGALLEKWCFEKAVEHGFNAEKIILINPKAQPTDNYYHMIKQIETFPKKPLRFECEFYGDYSQASYFEIDLAIKVPKYLFIFECKSYGIPFSEDAKFLEWMDNFHYNMHQLIIKGKHIMVNIENNIIQDGFLNEIEKFIPIIIQTEGLFPSFSIIQFNKFEKFLEELKHNLDNNTLEEFLKRPIELKF